MGLPRFNRTMMGIALSSLILVGLVTSAALLARNDPMKKKAQSYPSAIDISPSFEPGFEQGLGGVACLPGEGLISEHSDGPFDFDESVTTPQAALLIHYRERDDPERIVAFYRIVARTSSGVVFAATTSNGLRSVIGVGGSIKEGWGVVNAQTCTRLIFEGV